VSGLYIFLSVAYIAICAVLITIILLQKKRTAGLGAGMSGMGNAPTYWDQNKGRSLEGALEKYSKILGTVFIVLSLVLTVIR